MDLPTDIIQLAALGVIGRAPGLIVRVRPANPFERATWANCPKDGLRVLLDEDGRVGANLDVSDLPTGFFISSREWQRAIKQNLGRIGR